VSNSMTVSFPGGFRVDAHYNSFTICTDQSEKYGGNASAPEPYDLFLASLATCAGIYVLKFCTSRSIPSDGISLVQSWQRDKHGKIASIALDIVVPPSFPERYHQALIRTASQCAVKKTLENPPLLEVTTSVQKSE